MFNFIFVTLVLISTSWAHEHLETKTHVDVHAKVSELRSRYGAKNVLVVFDIDNTLLKAKQPLGSDQWFEWQAEEIKRSSSDASFKSFEELLEAQTYFFQLSSMSLTEQVIPNIVTDFKRAGHLVVCLTSRGPNVRDVTERELEKNALTFKDSSIMNGIPFHFVELPFKNKVSFMNGIFMTAGHHKGEALQYLLKRSGKRFKAIVFVDDHKKHTSRVFETFSLSDDVEIIAFRYSKEDETVLNFQNGSKALVLDQTRKIMQSVRQVFNNYP